MDKYKWDNEFRYSGDLIRINLNPITIGEVLQCIIN